MKQHLGKVLLLLVFSLLNAKDFDYSIQVNKSHPYVKEAVILHFDVNQTNHDIVLLFDFDIPKNLHYDVQRINIQEEDNYHNKHIRYTYLLYPLSSGQINIAFTLTQKATTDESVAYSFSGDRDNVKTLETKDTKIEIPNLLLKVKALPKGTDIVGDFTLDYKVLKHTAQAYEALPLKVTIKGLGYPPILENILPKNTNFQQFIEKPSNTKNITHKDTYNILIYNMALSHNKSFRLQALNIHAFNPLLEKSYILTLDSQDFSIEEVNTTKLLDTIDSPALFQIDWQWLQSLFTYILVFILGYSLALFKKQKKPLSKKSLDKGSLLKIKIIHASDYKALLQLLMAQEEHDFSSTIKRLEAVCYNNKSIPLKRLKKEAQDNIHA
jgi:hypothetical protein